MGRIRLPDLRMRRVRRAVVAAARCPSPEQACSQEGGNAQELTSILRHVRSPKSPPHPANCLSRNMAATFTVFATRSGNVPYDPGNTRIKLDFVDPGGVIRGRLAPV